MSVVNFAKARTLLVHVSYQREVPLLAKPFFLFPAYTLLAVFFIFPTVATVVIGFTDWTLGAKDLSFIGWENYFLLLNSDVFFTSITNTIYLNLFVVPTSFVVALCLALAINNVKRFSGFWQAVYFLPVTSNLVAMAVVWDYLLHPKLGYVNTILLSIGIQSINWLNDPDIVLYTIGFISMWQLLGFYMVLFLAGLLSIPRTLYEAALVDGARSNWDHFVHVTWPMLGPTSLFVFIITVIKSFQIFDVVKVLTQGGPDKASEIILHTLYQEGFIWFRTSVAAAIATVFFAIMLALTIYQMRIFEKHVHYQ